MALEEAHPGASLEVDGRRRLGDGARFDRRSGLDSGSRHTLPGKTISVRDGPEAWLALHMAAVALSGLRVEKARAGKRLEVSVIRNLTNGGNYPCASWQWQWRP